MMTSTAAIDGVAESQATGGGAQTLLRGLDVIEALAHDVLNLADLSQRLDLTRSTTHRLASALVERGYLAFTPRSGYRLGPKLLELGFLAQSQADLVQVVRPHIEALAASTGDTVHFGVIDRDQALYLDKIPGRRRINISSRVGDRQSLSSTGLGKALMIDHPSTYWLERFAADQAAGSPRADQEIWTRRMEAYAIAGRAFDLEENEDQIRCVAAPFRGADGKIAGAISVTSAAQYMSDDRMNDLSNDVLRIAAAISRDLGWVPPKL